MVKVVADVKKPAGCTDAEIAAFCRFVEQGGEVDRRGLEERLRQAVALSFVYVEGSLVGVAGLKQPHSSYRDSVFYNAGAQSQAADFNHELGWVYVPPEHRSRGYSLVAASAAMSQAVGVAAFATTRDNNEAMARTLRKLGFVLDGKPWKSTRGGYNLVLYVLLPRESLQLTNTGSSIDPRSTT